MLLGHSFGAAVATTMAAANPGLVRHLVLEELPGRSSVAWAAEARAVLTGAADALLDRDGLISRTSRDQPRWQEEDCRHAVDDLAACHEHDVAAGLDSAVSGSDVAYATGRRAGFIAAGP